MAHQLAGPFLACWKTHQNFWHAQKACIPCKMVRRSFFTGGIKPFWPGGIPPGQQEISWSSRRDPSQPMPNFGMLANTPVLFLVWGLASHYQAPIKKALLPLFLLSPPLHQKFTPVILSRDLIIWNYQVLAHQHLGYTEAS